MAASPNLHTCRYTHTHTHTHTRTHAHTHVRRIMFTELCSMPSFFSHDALFLPPPLSLSLSYPHHTHTNTHIHKHTRRHVQVSNWIDSRPVSYEATFRGFLGTKLGLSVKNGKLPKPRRLHAVEGSDLQDLKATLTARTSNGDAGKKFWNPEFCQSYFMKNLFKE